jgi:hypothetical protein
LYTCRTYTETEFLGEIQTKVLRVFLLAIPSHLYSFALRFLFLQTHATSYSFYSSVTVHCKGGRRKTDRKPYPPPYGLRNPYSNLKSENSQDYAQKPQRNWMFMNSASVNERKYTVLYGTAGLALYRGLSAKNYLNNTVWNPVSLVLSL